MKKILLTTILSVFYFTSASAEVGVNIGVSGQMGLFAASAKEVHTDTTSAASDVGTSKGSEHAAVGFASIFIEKTLGDRLSIGIDYVPSALESDTVESAKQDLSAKGDVDTGVARTNKVRVDFDDLTTYYVAFNIGESMYIKAGLATVDVITKENLETGATYANTDLDGNVFGIGYNKTFDNTMFVRVEGNYMDFDGASLSSGDNKITLNQLHGVTGKISVGKSF
jgi:hypothetical protein